jgi:RNA polymerase sigma factor (TIGR02999 family)
LLLRKPAGAGDISVLFLPGRRERVPEVTLILDRVNRGDARAMDELIPLVYDELRHKARLYMARERVGHTLQATAVVHEAFARLLGGGPHTGDWEGGKHFFHAAAEVMRQLLVDHSRRRAAEKRGGGRQRKPLEGVDVEAPADGFDWQGLDDALAALKQRDERRYQVVLLRYFAGLPEHDVAKCLDISEKTVQRDWKVSRMFLLAHLQGEAPEQAAS